jgi:hypothetical protein
MLVSTQSSFLGPDFPSIEDASPRKLPAHPLPASVGIAARANAQAHAQAM